MKPPTQTIILKLMLWVWLLLTLGSLALTFFEHMNETFTVAFTLGAVGLPILVFESLFAGAETIAVAMFFVVLITLTELGFLLYNGIQWGSNADEFPPVQEHLIAFFFLLVISLVRFILGWFIVAFMGKVRKVPFEDRCDVKPHKK